MKSQTRRTTAVAGFMLTACLTPECARPQDLHGSVTLYGWLPGPDAEVTSTRGGVSASTSVRARDVLEALNVAFTATGQVNYGCFGLVQDVVYPDPGTSGNLSGPLAGHRLPRL